MAHVKANAPSLLLAISKAPVVHPESGRPLTAEDHRRRLLEPTGLDAAARELMSALNESHVILYHLLERGDASWLTRTQVSATAGDGLIDNQLSLAGQPWPQIATDCH